MELISNKCEYIPDAYTYTFFFKDDSLYIKYFDVNKELIMGKIIPNKRLGNIATETVKEILDKTLDINVFPKLPVISKAVVYTLNNDSFYSSQDNDASLEISYFDRDGRFILSKRIGLSNRGLTPMDEERIRATLDPDEHHTFIPSYIVMNEDTIIGMKALLFSDLDQIIRVIPIKEYSLRGLVRGIKSGSYDVDITRLAGIKITKPEDDTLCVMM